MLYAKLSPQRTSSEARKFKKSRDTVKVRIFREDDFIMFSIKLVGFIKF